MAQQSFSTVRYDQDSIQGDAPYMGGGPTGPVWRDALDAARSGYNRDPGAQYPDGYLSTVFTTRHADKIAGTLWRQQRSYSRGVHKGTTIDQSDYLWPDEFNLMSGIENQAYTGMRYVSPAMLDGIDPGARLVNDGKPGPRDWGLGARGPVPSINDPVRANILKQLTPNWQ